MDSREQGFTPLLAAAQGGHTGVCKLLLETGKANVKETTPAGFTPLLVAARFGHTEVCELLLKEGKANIEEIDDDGDTALNLAATKGDASTVALLLSKGAKVDTRDKSGFTPLLAAADEGHTEVCELLLDNGSDLEESEPDTQMTALHEAAGHGHEHCHHMAAINITEKAAAVPGFEVYNCHENHLLHLNLGAGVNRDAA